MGLDEVFFELSADGLEVGLRFPKHTAETTSPDLIVLEGRPGSTSPLTQEWLRNHVLASKRSTSLNASASGSRPRSRPSSAGRTRQPSQPIYGTSPRQPPSRQASRSP